MKNGKRMVGKSKQIKHAQETIFNIVSDHTLLGDNDLAKIIIDIHKMFGDEIEQLRQVESVTPEEIAKLKNHNGIFLPGSDRYIFYSLETKQVIKLYGNGKNVDAI